MNFILKDENAVFYECGYSCDNEFLLCVDGVKYLGAGNAAAYIILVPILGILFSAVWLNEQVDFSLIIGGILAVSGLGIMHWGRRRLIK